MKYYWGSFLCAIVTMLLVDFGWRAPYWIGSAWLSMALMGIAVAVNITGFIAAIERHKYDQG
jgi:hypothetical protein